MDDPIPVEQLIAGAAQDAGGWLGALAVAQVATSADGTIVRWSNAAQELLGYAPPQVVGRHISELLHPGPTAASAAPCGRPPPPAAG